MVPVSLQVYQTVHVANQMLLVLARQFYQSTGIQNGICRKSLQSIKSTWLSLTDELHIFAGHRPSSRPSQRGEKSLKN